MRCIDLGCGSGDVTFAIAALIADGGHATGLDMDEVKISLASETAG